MSACTILRDEVLNHGGHICNAKCERCATQSVVYTTRPTELLTERRVVCIKCDAHLATITWKNGEYKPSIVIA